MAAYIFLIRGQVNAQVVVGYQGETQSYIDYWVIQRQLKGLSYRYNTVRIYMLTSVRLVSSTRKLNARELSTQCIGSMRVLVLYRLSYAWGPDISQQYIIMSRLLRSGDQYAYWDSGIGFKGKYLG